MHVGRSHHLSLEIAVSILGGFTASFLAFVTVTYTQHYNAFLRSQLLAGDPAKNREFPTVLNTMHAAMNGENPIVQSMGSYGWWFLVVIGGIIASCIVFRLARRYV